VLLYKSYYILTLLLSYLGLFLTHSKQYAVDRYNICIGIRIIDAKIRVIDNMEILARQQIDNVRCRLTLEVCIARPGPNV